ncbi:MAG: transposase [Rhodocyclales bacterium GT-UBC]|nr:MAG: transposase [Rhodocyclales bacterium GT-UBC]
MGAVPYIFRGCEYMPIKLKGVMIKHGISHPQLAAEVFQAKDVPLSRSSVNQILNHSYFPKSLPVENFKAQIEAVLAKRGISAEELATIWEPEGSDEFKGVFPVGSHVGKPAPKPPGFRAAKRPEPDFKPLEIQMLSPQAKRHFNLFRDPFQNDVNSPDDVFLSDAQRYVVEAMIQTALVGGITAVVAESGAGKSTLRKLLQFRINAERQQIRLIFPQALDKTKLSTGAICTAIIKDLEPETSVTSGLESQARQVKRVLLQSARAGFKHVLMIEEAHDLSIQTLKYLKRFYEIESEDGFGKVLSIVLVGQNEMRLKLDANRYPMAREFINRCEIATLEPLHGQVGAYLAHKFARCGLSIDKVFDESAFDAIRDRWTKIDPATREVKTQLYPLIVNNTATNAMNRAAALGLPIVTADLIKEL